MLNHKLKKYLSFSKEIQVLDKKNNPQNQYYPLKTNIVTENLCYIASNMLIDFSPRHNMQNYLSQKMLDFADIAQCSVAILQKENYVEANHEILKLPKDNLHKIIYISSQKLIIIMITFL